MFFIWLQVNIRKCFVPKSGWVIACFKKSIGIFARSPFSSWDGEVPTPPSILTSRPRTSVLWNILLGRCSSMSSQVWSETLLQSRFWCTVVGWIVQSYIIIQSSPIQGLSSCSPPSGHTPWVRLPLGNVHLDMFLFGFWAVWCVYWLN